MRKNGHVIFYFDQLLLRGRSEVRVEEREGGGSHNIKSSVTS